MRRLRSIIQDCLNPVHVYCRLHDLGMSKPVAWWIACRLEPSIKPILYPGGWTMRRSLIALSLALVGLLGIWTLAGGVSSSSHLPASVHSVTASTTAPSLDLQGMVNACATGLVTIPAGQWAIGSVVCNNPIRIEGSTPDLCQLWGTITFNASGSSLRSVQMNGSGPGSGTGVTFANATGLCLLDVLIQNFDVDVHILAGGGWRILATDLYTPTQYGLVAENVSNPDQGDNLVGDNCVFYTSNGIAGIHYLSGGGLKVIGNKFLLGQWAILGEINGVTSDLIIMGNSMEAQVVNFVAVHPSGSGSFRNVNFIGNQLTSPANTQAAHFDNVSAVVSIGNMNTNANGGTVITSPDHITANELLN